MRDYLQLFARGFAIVALTAAQTVALAGHHTTGVFFIGFGISFVWFGNARSAARADLPFARETYALGAATGSVVGMLVAVVAFGR